MTSKYFPINTQTACRLKWAWSSLYLNTGTTGSCHRASVSTLTLEDFDNFHNTPAKLEARKLMLDGKWPGNGCEYCQDIESAGGQSDRQFQNNIPDVYPDVLDRDSTAINVQPSVLEVFFSNVCNFKCVYCKSSLSSQIQAEEQKFGSPIIKVGHKPLDNTYKNYAPAFWKWFRLHGHDLQRLNILGGEPFIQKDFFELLKYYQQNPNPSLEFNVVTNLHVTEERLRNICDSLQNLHINSHVKRVDILVSIDSWGPGQEYVRHGFNREIFERNLKILTEYKVFRIGLLSTVCSLTINELPELADKFQEWNTWQEIFWYMHLVLPNNDSPFSPALFDYGVFEDAINRTLTLMPTNTWDEKQTVDTFKGIVSKIKENSQDNTALQKELIDILNNIDSRRGLNWQQSFPWLNEKMKNVV